MQFKGAFGDSFCKLEAFILPPPILVVLGQKKGYGLRQRRHSCRCNAIIYAHDAHHVALDEHEQSKRARRRRGIRPLILININASAIYAVV
jgi:hypothetical protein